MVKIIIFHYVMYCMYFFPVIFSFNDIATTVNDNQTEMDICNEEKTSIFDMRNEETELNEDIGFKSSDESSDEMEFDINEYEQMKKIIVTQTKKMIVIQTKKNWMKK